MIYLAEIHPKFHQDYVYISIYTRCDALSRLIVIIKGD